ncbi:MAG TPA: hypothetical protein VE175_02615, partial [Woeseiaceae bacterium]|nr:hypothetical protein [Woeseiaceae bacterium]
MSAITSLFIRKTYQSIRRNDLKINRRGYYAVRVKEPRHRKPPWMMCDGVFGSIQLTFRGNTMPLPFRKELPDGRSLARSAGMVLMFCAAAFPPHALAQSDEPVEEIVVTGSYVARPTQAMESSPIQIIGTEEIEESGLIGVDDMLLLNTANIGSVGGAQDLAAGGADDRATRSA